MAHLFSHCPQLEAAAAVGQKVVGLSEEGDLFVAADNFQVGFGD
jgi:hypothetical protein